VAEPTSHTTSGGDINRWLPVLVREANLRVADPSCASQRGAGVLGLPGHPAHARARTRIRVRVKVMGLIVIRTDY
jgi:hypothetical protein